MFDAPKFFYLWIKLLEINIYILIIHLSKYSYTVDSLNSVGYQFSWFSWRVPSTNSSTHEMVIFCMSYERKYYDHEF